MVSSRRRVALRTCQEGADHVKGSYGCRSSNGWRKGWEAWPRWRDGFVTRACPQVHRIVYESARGFSPVIKAQQSGLKQKRNTYWASAAGPWRGAPRGTS